MRRTIGLVIGLCMLAFAACGFAEGVTLRTFTPFAGEDFAAQAYMDMATQWEEENSAFVEDYSALLDERGFEQLVELMESGEADVVIIPYGAGFESSLIPLGQWPQEIGAKRFASIAGEDADVLAPVRINWEALYVNLDVLEANGLTMPQTFEDLLRACQTLSANGVTPIANALGEWSEIVFDCAALAGAPAAVYGSAESLEGAKQYVAALAAVGAFGTDTFTATDENMVQSFLAGDAAMRIDEEYLMNEISAERHDRTVVALLPTVGGAACTSVPGSVAYGMGVSAACGADQNRAAAAASFMQMLLTEKNLRQLVTPAQGALGDSVYSLVSAAQDCTGYLYDTNPDGFDAWLEETIAELQGK